MENKILDHMNLCRFRNEIVDKKAYENLLKKINKELKNTQDIVKTRVILEMLVLLVRSFALNGSPSYVVEARKEEGQKQISQRKARVKKKTQSGVDTQGKWLKKSGKLYYGYKNHIGGYKNGMILSVHSVAVNEHDSRGLKPLISKLGYKPREVYSDKGYQVPVNMSYFHIRGIKDRIQKKAYRNHPLSRIVILFNIIS
ncbi:MAG: transposase [Flavobacteriales bacterium Tduv]